MLLSLALVALLGVAIAVPALAAAETKLEVNENCVEPDWPCWATPGSSQPAAKVTIAAGASITFVDSKTAANLAWAGTAPACEPGVPVAPAAPRTGWEGKCAFATPGTYKFESSTLFNDGVDNYTRYEVLVEGTPKGETTTGLVGSQTEATLSGNVKPEGNAVSYHFVYGSASLGEHSSAPTSLGADFTSHSVSFPVAGLSPGTEYHFELIVGYGAGQTASGGSKSFTTPPAAEPLASTLAASLVQETDAQLNGKVDPEGGAESEYFFEWGAGPGTSYEHATIAVSLPSDGAQHTVFATVTGLTPGSEYHFRLVAKNELGSVPGADLKFTTTTTPTKEPAQEAHASEPSATSGPSGGSSSAGSGGPPPPGKPEAEPSSGPLFKSIQLASTQHGGKVRGSLVVSAAGSGGWLQIELLVKGAAAPVGKLVRSALRPGKLAFALHLSSDGKAALRRDGRLSLTVKFTLTPPHGAAVAVTRTVAVRP
jgi:hypothetical protein